MKNLCGTRGPLRSQSSVLGNFMSPDQLNELKNSEVTRKRLAKFMAHFCFRNSKLEDFHDRISDAEMKALMIDVVNHSHLFLSVLFSSTASNEIIEILKQGDDLPPEWKDWNEPEISDELTKNAKRVLDLIAKSRQ
jgi:hypothetical protein